jgi:hypothetical protein
VPAHEDDPLGAEPLRGQHRGQADRTVADHRDGGARVDTGGGGCVVAGAEHVGQGEQGRQQHGVLADVDLDQGALGLRNPDSLALSTVEVVAPLTSATAGGR